MGSSSFVVLRSARVVCLIGAGLMAVAPSSARADDSIGWDFGFSGTGGGAVPTANRVNNASSPPPPVFSSVGPATIGNFNGPGNASYITASNPSDPSNYTLPGGGTYGPLKATGGFNIAVAGITGSLNTTDNTGSGYFAFSVTPNQPLKFTGFNFGSRSSTNYGPQTYTLFYSTTSATAASTFTQLDGGGKLTNNNTYQLISDAFKLSADPNVTVNFRLYGSDGTGGTAPYGTTNWRTDDWQLTYAAAPEPAGLALVGVAVAPLLAARRRRGAALR